MHLVGLYVCMPRRFIEPAGNFGWELSMMPALTARTSNVGLTVQSEDLYAPGAHSKAIAVARSEIYV